MRPLPLRSPPPSRGRCSAAYDCVRGQENLPARAATCSRPTTSRASIHGRSGFPLLPRRFLRFMAKSELYWCPAQRDPAGGGAFPVRRGRARPGGDRRTRSSSRARETSSRCSRRGRGGRKGSQDASSRGRTPARRGSRSRPACRSCPPRSAAPTGCAQLGPLRVAYGEPIALDDLHDADVREAAQEATDRLMAEIDGSRRRTVSTPLLVVDGDSLAHRAYHALPKSIRAPRAARQRPRRLHEHARSGSGRPSSRAPSSSAGTRSACRRTGTRRFAAYQAGREFDDEMLEQLDLLPELVARLRLRRRQGDGLRGRRLPRRGRRAEEARGGTSLVATSDRDAFQLASERTTILQPMRGVSELARDRPGRGARALRRRAGAGARLHRAPRRPVGQDPRRARRRPEDGGRRSSAQYGSLEARSRPAASRPRRRSCGSTGESRRWTPPPLSLPRRSDPDWAEASAFVRANWGLGRPGRQDRRSARSEPSDRADVLTHPALARLHPTGRTIPESPEPARGSARRRSPAARATDGLRPRTAVERVTRARARRADPAIDEPTWLDGDTVVSETSCEAALLAAGRAIEAARRGGLRARAPARATTRCRTARWASASSTTSPIAARHAQAELGVGRVAIVDWDVHHGNGTQAIFCGRRLGALRLAAPVAVLSRHAAARTSRRETTLNVPLPRRLRRRRVPRARSTRSSSRRSRGFEPDLVLVSAGFDAHERRPARARCA